MWFPESFSSGSHSGSENALLVRPVGHGDPYCYIPVRLTDGNSFYTATGSVGGGGGGSVTQGTTPWIVSGSNWTQQVAQSTTPWIVSGSNWTQQVTGSVGLAGVANVRMVSGTIVEGSLEAINAIRHKVRYDFTETANYVGHAALGTAEGSTGWTIKRTSITGGNPTVDEWTGPGTAIWNNRTTETYT